MRGRSDNLGKGRGRGYLMTDPLGRAVREDGLLMPHAGQRPRWRLGGTQPIVLTCQGRELIATLPRSAIR